MGELGRKPGIGKDGGWDRVVSTGVGREVWVEKGLGNVREEPVRITCLVRSGKREKGER